MRATVCALLIAVLTAHATLAAGPNPTRIRVDDVSHGGAGARLVFAFKEQVRSSQSFRLAEGDGEGLHVSIETLDQSSEDASDLTIYSVIWSLKMPKEPFPLLIAHMIGYCAAKRIDETAGTLLARTDKVVSDVLAALEKH